MWHYYLLFIIGFLLLYFGADWLVKGAANLARRMGISPMVIGLTVVAFGTSAPEMVVSVLSSLQGKSMIAVGNAVGSNICNIALVLGAAAFITPILSSRPVIKRDFPLMLAISAILLVFSLNSHVSRLEGFALLIGVILYTLYNYHISKKESASVPESGKGPVLLDTSPTVHPLLLQLGLVIAGITGVITGAQLLINSAVAIMQDFGVSEKFIGLTVVALGTSLPELATSIVAAMRKEMDISIGNLIGSNVFNILGVVGLAALVRPIPVPGGFFGSGLFVDYLAMIAVSVLAWFLMGKSLRLSRVGGTLLLCFYVAYVGYLIVKGG